jgi:plasmid stability protein
MRSEWQPDGNRLCTDQSDSRQFKERELGEYRMGSILVRDLDQKTIERLKERAHLNGRSLRQEVKALLDRAAETFTVREARRVRAAGGADSVNVAFPTAQN